MSNESDEWGKISRSISDAWGGPYFLNNVMDMLNKKGGDPLLAISTAGHYMVGSAWTAITAVLVTVGLVEGGKEPLFGFLADKATGVMSGLAGVLGFISGFIMTLLGILLAAGYGMAYYIPALPWIIWSLAVIGWVVSLVVLIVGAPVWALAVALPEGEGITGNYGREGLLSVLSVALPANATHH